MAITRTPIVDDDNTGQTGTVLNNAWKQELYDQIDGVVGGASSGAWVDVPFTAGNFTASSGTWTVASGNVATFAYTVVSKVIHFVMSLDSTGNSASTTRLFVTLPAGIPLSTRAVNAPLTYYMPGGAGTGFVEINIGSQTLGLLRDISGTAWPITSVGNLFTRAEWFYPIA